MSNFRLKKAFIVSTVILFCGSVHATDGIYGSASVASMWKTGLDNQSGIATGHIGFIDSIKTENYSVTYNLESFYAESGNRFVGVSDGDNFQINKAYVLVRSDFGGLLLGKGYSGAYMDQYNRTDIHPFTNGEKYSANKQLWAQGKYSDNIAAYITPQIKTRAGNIGFKFAYVSHDAQNDANDDVLVARILYSKDNFSASFNYNRIDENLSGNEGNHHYNRYAAGADYSIDGWKFATTVEVSKNAFHPTSVNGYDENVYGFAVSKNIDKISFGVSYQLRNSDLEKKDDIGLAIASAQYQLDEKLALAIETAYYTGGNEFESFAEDETFTVGAIYKF
ncbi:porin [Shewanella sp. A14]